MSSEENLKPFSKLAVEEQREIARKGGKASVKARREKKLMSQIYAEFLIKEHKIKDATGGFKNVTGHELCNMVMSKVMGRGDSSSVRLLKEIRDATEGSRVTLNHEGKVNINIIGVEPKNE